MDTPPSTPPQSPGSPSTTPPPAGCVYEREGDTAVVTLKPSLSDVKWDQIESLGNSIEGRLDNDKPKKVVFDISPLTYMGSAMVALVVRWWKAVEKAGGKSVVVCQDENVMEVLRLASLDKHWTICETREEAFDHLGSRASGGLMSSGADATATNGDGVSGTGPMLPLILGGVALTVAIVGLVLFLVQVGSPMLGLGLALGGGLTALVAGVLTVIVCGGTRKTAGIAVAVFGALLAGLGAYLLQTNRVTTPAVETEVEDGLDVERDRVETDRVETGRGVGTDPTAIESPEQDGVLSVSADPAPPVNSPPANSPVVTEPTESGSTEVEPLGEAGADDPALDAAEADSLATLSESGLPVAAPQ